MNEPKKCPYLHPINPKYKTESEQCGECILRKAGYCKNHQYIPNPENVAYMNKVAQLLGVEIDKVFYAIDSEGERTTLAIGEEYVEFAHPYFGGWERVKNERVAELIQGKYKIFKSLEEVDQYFLRAEQTNFPWVNFSCLFKSYAEMEEK